MVVSEPSWWGGWRGRQPGQTQGAHEAGAAACRRPRRHRVPSEACASRARRPRGRGTGCGGRPRSPRSPTGSGDAAVRRAGHAHARWAPWALRNRDPTRGARGRQLFPERGRAQLSRAPAPSGTPPGRMERSLQRAGKGRKESWPSLRARSPWGGCSGSPETPACPRGTGASDPGTNGRDEKGKFWGSHVSSGPTPHPTSTHIWALMPGC